MAYDAKKVLVFGAGGAIGNALSVHYAERGANVFAVTRTLIQFDHTSIQNLVINYDDERAFKKLLDQMFQGRAPDIIIVAIGALCIGQHGPEKALKDIDISYMMDLYYVNTVLPALIMKFVLPLIPSDHSYVFAAFSARVGSISDNRLGGWYSYRASKAALNMLIKTAAIEVGRRNKNAVVVGLHPGTVDSKLSKPFQSNVPAESLFSPQQSAAYLASVINNLNQKDSGHVFAWDGQKIEA